MSDKSTRRDFLKILGISAGASVIVPSAFAAISNHQEILKLDPEQKDFMLSYGKWMDEFIEVIQIQKAEPDNLENHGKMMKLTEQAELWRPQLTEFMKEKNFALIYDATIDKMRKEI